MSDVKIVLKKLHKTLQILPTSRRKMLYERLRFKVADDIVSVMRERECSLEELAKILKLKKKEMREWIWDRDLTLSELARLLDCLDSEFYPIIRTRKLWRNL